MTFLGSHTIGETAELLAEKNSQIGQLNKGILAHTEEIDSKDASFINEWAAFVSSWNAFARNLRDKLESARQSSIGPDSMVTTEDEYQSIVEKLQKTPGHFQRGDMADFVDRLGKMGVDINVVSHQPEAADVDLGAFKATDSVTRGIDSAATVVTDGIGNTAMRKVDDFAFRAYLPFATITLGALLVGWYVTTSVGNSAKRRYR